MIRALRRCAVACDRPVRRPRVRGDRGDRDDGVDSARAEPDPDDQDR